MSTIKFKRIELKDMDKIYPYLLTQKYRESDYTYLSMYMWAEVYNIEYYITDSYILFREHYDDIDYFYYPLGNEERCFKDLKDNGYSEITFSRVCKDVFEPMSKYCDILDITHDRDGDDYIYEFNDLKTLKGKKYEKKRNLVNQFNKLYSNVVIKEITSLNAKDCIEFQKVWETYNNNEEHLIESKECIKMLQNYESLPVKGIALYDKNKIIGYTIYEQLDDTLICHIEKGNYEYKGIYQFIHHAFLNYFNFTNVEFVNREDDAGDEGLRQSKLSYHPKYMLEKHILKVRIK